MRSNCDEIVKKLNRISGQITGISNMIESGRDITEVLQQIQAARAALSAVALSVLKDDAVACLAKDKTEDKLKEFENLVKSFFKIAD